MFLSDDFSMYGGVRRYSCWLWMLFFFSLAATAPAGAAGDHGNSCETASLVAPDTTLVAYHDFPQDQDYFRVEINSSGLLILRLDAAESPGLRMQLLGEACAGPGAGDVEYVTRSDVQTIFKVRQPGVYYFKVLGSSTGASSYGLSTTFLPDRPFVDQDVVFAGDAAEDCPVAGAAETLVFDADQLVSLTEESDEIDNDVIIIRLTSTGFLEVGAEGTAVTGSLYSGRSCGPEVQLRGDVDFIAGESILLEAPAGEYFLRLAGGPGASGEYRLRIAYLNGATE